MKKSIKKVSLILMVLCILLTLIGCGSNNTQPSESNEQNKGNSENKLNMFTYVTHSDPMVFWDPAETWAAEIIVMQNLYESLVRIDPVDDSIIPVLATDWVRSEDGLEWRFTLREGVKFHSGKILTPDMAARSLMRTIEIGKGAAYVWDGVEDIVADGNELVFKLSRPLPLLQIVSASYGAYIYDPDIERDWYYEANADGTGPYKMMSYQKDSEMILEKHTDYWGGWDDKDGHFDVAVVKTIAESSIRRQLIVSGEVDFIQQLSVEDIEAIKNEPGISVSNVVSFQQLNAFLNTQKEPLNNKYIRQAISYLTPYQDIVDHVMMGNATQARGVIPPNLWGYGENLLQYTYDLDKAKELLAKGGYPDGGFKLLYTYTSGDTNLQKVGELLKDSFARANIDLELRAMTTDAKYNLTKAQDPNERQDITLLYWWPDNLDPVGYMDSQFHSEEEVGFNFAYYSNSEVDRLIDEAIELSGISIEEASEKYIEAQEIIIEEAPALFLYCENYIRPYRSDIKGYIDNPVYPNVVYFYDVYR